jgi:solute:Na+ symporter, SSS family
LNLALIDWLIVIAMVSLMVWGVLYTKNLMQSVSDFLTAGRSAGRYLISMSHGMAQLGAITIIGMLEVNYISGFSLRWWEFTNGIIILVITVSGWVVYRFRQTRAMTMAQFFEMRYSKKFRIFAGILAFISGMINFGLFPIVGARFFTYFIGLPETYSFIGLEISTLHTLIIILLSISLFFVFTGGQISVIIADFIQGVFVNVVFVAVAIYFAFIIDWNVIYEALSSAPKDASLINPFKTSKIEDFNFWYFFIGMVGIWYGKLSWQGPQGSYTSAKSPHEAKMAEVLGNLRNIPQWSLFLYFVPVVAYTVMHHVDFTEITSSINPILEGISEEAIRVQLTVPLVLTKLLPVGLIGSLAAVILAAFISTHDTYMHSWASIFIQDVFLPLTGKKLSPEKHIKYLKYSIIGVVVYLFLFSLFFTQTQYIFLFFAITGSIFVGGAGAVIIGGLYWKKGTTGAAWTAMITGAVVSVGGLVINKLDPEFPINGQMFWGIAMGMSSVIYIVVSLLSNKKDFNLDKLLHRGKYQLDDDIIIVNKVPLKGLKVLGMGKEFTKGDKLIYIITYSWTFIWTVIFIIGTVYNLTSDVHDKEWMNFWEIFVYINIAISLIIVVWFTIGGLKDGREMFAKLRSAKRDHHDDGQV